MSYCARNVSGAFLDRQTFLHVRYGTERQSVTACRSAMIMDLLGFSDAAEQRKLPVMATTTAPIYRIGNQQFDLLYVRSLDVSVYSDPAQIEICVQPQSANTTPGISCCSTRQAASTAAAAMARRSSGVGRVWELPAGSAYDDTTLRLWQPRPDKWYWSPTRNMPGSEFIAALRAVNAQFQ
jgi:hypothetical protein